MANVDADHLKVFSGRANPLAAPMTIILILAAVGCAILARLLAEPDHRRHAELPPDVGAGLPVDQGIVAVRKLAFRLAAEALVEPARDDQPEHAVAEEFEALVIVPPKAGVGQCPLEQIESLEQLRVLWHGERIAVHVSAERPGPGVDTPDDLARVRALLG